MANEPSLTIAFGGVSVNPAAPAFVPNLCKAPDRFRGVDPACGFNELMMRTAGVASAAVLKWAFDRTSRVLFFPDQHLGRNTALRMGITLDQMPVWNPHDEQLGGNTEQ